MLLFPLETILVPKTSNRLCFVKASWASQTQLLVVLSSMSGIGRATNISFRTQMLYQHAQFVILTHTHPFLHWDLLLEQTDNLRAWRLLDCPDATGGASAEPLPDHRKLYLEDEGPVGGNRGEVTQWDKGEYTLIEQTPEYVRFRLSGARLTGEYIVILDATTETWRFRAEADSMPGSRNQ